MCFLFIKTAVVIIKSTAVSDCVNSARTAKVHANPTFAWTDLATAEERQLTTG